jgi:hypothetical protein
MPLRSTQAQTEMSTRNLLGGKALPGLEADNLTAFCELTVKKIDVSQSSCTACYTDSCTFTFL